MTKDTKAVIFDFDMTLADSSYAIHHCSNLLARKFGLEEVSREVVLAGIGLPIEDCWRLYWGDFKEEWLGIGDDSLGIDSDLNYCVRFDITQNEDSGAKDLWLFFLLQRKGIFSPVQVRNIKDSDMPEIEKFLKRQWKYIKKMWKEFSNVD